jgi:hypothetical protein
MQAVWCMPHGRRRRLSRPHSARGRMYGFPALGSGVPARKLDLPIMLGRLNRTRLARATISDHARLDHEHLEQRPRRWSPETGWARFAKIAPQ